jgi:phosphate transport system protein
MDNKLEYLKAQIMGMLDIVRLQITKAHTGFVQHDRDLARDVLHYEVRVNALELSIDRDCESLFMLHRLQGSRLRFVLATLKINTQLERIGDHAEMMGRITLQRQKKFKYPPELLEKLGLQEQFNLVIRMLNDSGQGYNFEDKTFSHHIFAQEARLRELVAASTPHIVQFAQADIANLEQYLLLTSYIQKMERMGELTKNIAEETIFYLDESILRHSDKKNIKEK